MRFLKNCSKISSNEKSKDLLFFWFSASCRSQVNWNAFKNNYTESNMPQNYVLTIFLQNVSHDYQTTWTAAKIVFISSKINLNIRNLKSIPYNQKKKKANSTWRVIFAVH